MKTNLEKYRQNRRPSSRTSLVIGNSRSAFASKTIATYGAVIGKSICSPLLNKRRHDQVTRTVKTPLHYVTSSPFIVSNHTRSTGHETKLYRRKRLSGCGASLAKEPSSPDSSRDPVANMKAKANDRALVKLGVRSLNLGSLPIGAKLVNLPNQVYCLLELKSGNCYILLKRFPRLLVTLVTRAG